jgi:type IV pilus assembly protein PilA
MNRANDCHSGGFTLIELMIILIIVAILATIAVPAYQDYAVRAKITECINNAGNVKVQVSEYRQTMGTWPPTEAEAGVNNPLGSSTFCLGFVNYDATTGGFEIDVDESAVDSSLASQNITPQLTPTALGSNFVQWSCTRGANTSIPAIKYLPAPCRGT